MASVFWHAGSAVAREVRAAPRASVESIDSIFVVAAYRRMIRMRGGMVVREDGWSWSFQMVGLIGLRHKHDVSAVAKVAPSQPVLMLSHEYCFHTVSGLCWDATSTLRAVVPEISPLRA